MAKKILVAAAMLTAATFAQAQSASLTVTGSITPGTCTMALGNGGAAAFGDLPGSTVKTWATVGTPPRYVSPTPVNVSLNIICGSATKMAMRVTDNHATTASPSVATDPASYGLGIYSPPGGATTNIGIFVIDHSDLKIKATAAATSAAPAAYLLSAGNATSTSTWSLATAAAAGNPVVNFLSAFSYGFSASAAATTPDSLVSIAGNLKVQVQPIVSVVNAATTNIVMSGSATVTLIGI